jgi:C4-dicarboxylate-specific signal transduction histidine kinase
MDHAQALMLRSGLEFYGKMSAAISHDLKNVLAVVNENAGLLDDLCLMAEKGRVLEPARLKRLAGDLKEQVRRGDAIAVRLNRFAHSVDDARARIELAELLELLAALATRFAAAKGVAVEVLRAAAPVHATTWPFLLLNLLWLCLEQALAAAGEGRSLQLAAEPAAEGVSIRISGLGGLRENTAAVPGGPPLEALSGALNARLETDARAGEITVRLGNAPA